MFAMYKKKYSLHIYVAWFCGCAQKTLDDKSF